MQRRPGLVSPDLYHASIIHDDIDWAKLFLDCRGQARNGGRIREICSMRISLILSATAVFETLENSIRCRCDGDFCAVGFPMAYRLECGFTHLQNNIG